MEEIEGLINLLLLLFPIGAGTRIVYCLIAMAFDSEEEKSYRTRMKNALIFLVLAESITYLLRSVIPFYF